MSSLVESLPDFDDQQMPSSSSGAGESTGQQPVRVPSPCTLNHSDEKQRPAEMVAERVPVRKQPLTECEPSAPDNAEKPPERHHGADTTKVMPLKASLSSVQPTTPVTCSSSNDSISSLAHRTISSVYNQSANKGTNNRTAPNCQLIAEFQKFSAVNQEQREQQLRRECLLWMLLCLAVALLFYYRAEKVVASRCSFN